MGILKKHLITVKVAVLFALLPVVLQAQNELVNAFKESYTLESKSNFKGAIEALKKAYQPDSYELNLRLGWLCYQAGLLKESVSYYNKAVALKPYAIEPKFGLAYPYSALGRWDDIIGLYNKILEVDPQNSIANYRLGLIYYNQGNYGRADPYIEKVVNLYPFDYDSLLLFAWNKLKLQKNREAKVLFQKVLLYSPDDPSALEGLGLIK